MNLREFGQAQQMPWLAWGVRVSTPCGAGIVVAADPTPYIWVLLNGATVSTPWDPVGIKRIKQGGDDE